LIEGALECLLDAGEGLLKEAKHALLFFLLFLLLLLIVLVVFDEPALVVVLCHVVLVVPCVLHSGLSFLHVHGVIDLDEGPRRCLLELRGGGLDSEILGSRG
jgi:hypothetical protein